jgi:hypothetical protein
LKRKTALTLRNGALAIQAMYQLGGPASATKHTFTPGKLNYTTSGLPAPINAASPNTGGQTMLFQNDAGQFLLYVWDAQVAPGGTAVPVTISFLRQLGARNRKGPRGVNLRAFSFSERGRHIPMRVGHIPCRVRTPCKASIR